MNLFDKLVKQEKNIIGADFVVCPYSSRATIKIAGVRLSLKTDSNELGIYRVKDYKNAYHVSEANLEQKTLFLESFPLVRLTIVCIENGNYYGFNQDGQFALRYCENVELFDKIVARYDGANFIYHEIDRFDPRITQAMRDGLETGICPQIHGFSLLDKKCFQLALANKKDPNEQRIKDYIQRGGAKYKGHKELGQNYTITYEIQGQTFTSVVNKTMNVEAAGICLSGTDRQYDLQSLISVVKEGIDEGRIYRVNI